MPVTDTDNSIIYFSSLYQQPKFPVTDTDNSIIYFSSLYQQPKFPVTDTDNSIQLFISEHCINSQMVSYKYGTDTEHKAVPKHNQVFTK
jgi:L-rhamnose isomerase